MVERVLRQRRQNEILVAQVLVVVNVILVADGRVLQPGHLARFFRFRRPQKVRLHPVHAPVAIRVGVNADEQLRALLVGEFRAVLQRHKTVRASGHVDLHAHVPLENSLQAFGDGQSHVLLVRAAPADGAGIVPPVAGVDYHGVDQPLAAFAAQSLQDLLGKNLRRPQRHQNFRRVVAAVDFALRDFPAQSKRELRRLPQLQGHDASHQPGIQLHA